jgi:hypothetical protein
VLFLWGLGGALLALVALLAVPLTLRSVVRWPGFSEAEVLVGPWRISRWHAPGPRSPRRAAGGSGQGGGQAGGPDRDAMLAALQAFFQTLRRTPVSEAALDGEGGVGDPAVTAVLYGLAWSVLGGVATAEGQGVRVRLTPKLEGPAGGRLHARARVTLTLGRLLLAGLRAQAARLHPHRP